MNREDEKRKPETETHPGTEPVAKNPNPRANENLHQENFKDDSGEGKTEVGEEITDGEDG